MSGRAFLDTNVLVYAFDDQDPQKQTVAQSILEEISRSGCYALSTQVLQEFFVVTTRKLARPLPEDDAERIVRRLARLQVVPTDAQLVVSAVALCRRTQVALWDALIMQAAIESACTTLLTEDLQDGLCIGPLTVRNPFSFSDDSSDT